MTLLRAMDPAYSQHREHHSGVLRDRRRSSSRTTDARARLVGDLESNIMPMVAADDVIDPETGEVYLDAGKPFTEREGRQDRRLAHQRSAW